jgi:hypothetical protein
MDLKNTKILRPSYQISYQGPTRHVPKHAGTQFKNPGGERECIALVPKLE